MKILFVSNSSSAMFYFRYNLIKYLIEKKNYRVFILTEFDGREEELKNIGCILININFINSSYNLFYNFLFLYKMIKIIKAYNFDYILTYGIKSNVFAGITSRLLKVKCISVITGINTHIYLGKNSFMKLFLNLLYFISTYKSFFIFLNNDDYIFFKKYIFNPKKHSKINSEGINIENFINFKRSNKKIKKFTFLMIARLIKDKGIIEYLEAAKSIRDKYPGKYNFILVGDLYKARNAIDKKLLDENIKDQTIIYRKHYDDIREIIQFCDSLILPSYREATGMVLVEAGLMKKPLIASNVPGCREVVIDKHNGFLCAPRSSSSLINAIESMLKVEPSKLIQMGNNSFDHCKKKFDIKKVINKYLEIFDKQY